MHTPQQKKRPDTSQADKEQHPVGRVGAGQDIAELVGGGSRFALVFSSLLGIIGV